LNFAIIIYVNFTVSAPILTSKLSVQLPHLLFILNLITVTLSLYYYIPKSQINNIQQIRNYLAHAVVKALKFCHATLFSNLYTGFKINECTEHILLSLIYKALTTAQPTYLYSLISIVQPPRGTCSSSGITLSRLPTPSTIKIINRSFHYASPHLWNLTSCLILSTLHKSLF